MKSIVVLITSVSVSKSYTVWDCGLVLGFFYFVGVFLFLDKCDWSFSYQNLYNLDIIFSYKACWLITICLMGNNKPLVVIFYFMYMAWPMWKWFLMIFFVVKICGFFKGPGLLSACALLLFYLYAEIFMLATKSCKLRPENMMSLCS